MSYFVQLTNAHDGSPMIVNTELIRRLRPHDDATVIAFDKEDVITVREPIAQVLSYLKHS